MNHKLYGRLTFPETPTYGPCTYAPILVLMTHNNYKNWQWFIHTKRKVPWRRKRYQQIYYFHIWVACIWRNYQWKILILNWRRAHGWKSSNWSVPNVDHKEIADVWPISFYSHIRSMWTVPKKYVESGRHVLWCNVAMCAGFGRQIVSPCCLTVVDDCATSRTWPHNAKTFYSYAKKRLHQNLNLNLKSKDTVPFLIISLVSDVLIVYLLRTFESYHIWKKRIHLLNTRSKIKSIRLRNAAL